MKDDTRLRTLTNTVQRLASIAVELRGEGGLVERIRQAQAGVPATNYQPGAGANGIADPTPAAALRRADRATQAERTLDRLLADLAERSRQLQQLADAYPPATVRPDTDPDTEPSCENCAQLRLPDGTRRREPVDLRISKPTTVAGRLDQARWLCRWCYNACSSWGRLPTADELEQHHAGKKVPWPDDIPKPP